MSKQIAKSVIREALHRLDDGEAIVLPLPSPLAYCIVATTPEAINKAKQRPLAQEVASWITDATSTFDDLELSAIDKQRLPWLLHSEGLTVLAPVCSEQPLPSHWRPSHRNGKVLLFGVRCPHLNWITMCKRPLYVSSANRTGMPSAVTANEVKAQLPSGTFIVDGDRLRDPSRHHGSTTMVKLSNGSLQVVRQGIQNETFGSVHTWVTDLLSRSPNA
ncbi:Sua5/YciO/YrdC/YwlC family protein [bacterium]|nr:Sua5/YciO/YrdC/YwlC family protein [bacterium]